MLIQNSQTKVDLSKVADKSTQNKILEIVENINFESVDNTVQIEQILQNQNISNAGLESISTTLIGDGSTNTGYGTGSMGEIVYDPDVTVWPDQDAYGRYVWNCTNFTLPEGVTMTPPLKCNGLYIYATTSCVINGTIDMREKRLTNNGPNGITNFLDINNVKYNLAKGGNTVKGGDGGRAGGIPQRYGSTEPTESDYNSYRYAGGKASNIVYAGNINGGGTSTYGTGAVAWNKGGSGTFSWGDVTDSTLYNQGSKGKTSSYRNATGALIIAAQSLTIGTTGFLNCEGLEGIAAVNGTTATLTGMGHTCGMSDYFIGRCGNGGKGTVAPTGGGPITIITENFVNNGKISTAGKSITCTSNGILSDVKYYDEDEGWGVTLGGAGGGDGTFISEAGELKIYIVGS